MLERWTKLSDSQLKTGALPAGLTLTCANQAIVDASEVQLRGKGQGFLDVALEQAESARKELMEQNRRLRGALVNAANELQSVLHAARTAGDADAPSEVRHFIIAGVHYDSRTAAGTDLQQHLIPEPAR